MAFFRLRKNQAPCPIEDALPRRTLGAALKTLPGRMLVFKTPTARYGGIQSAFCGLLCASTGFTTVFLLDYGVTINQVGFIVAALSCLSVAVQILAGGLIGRPGGPSLRTAVMVMTAASGLGNAAMLAVLGRSQAALVGLFVVSGVLAVSMQPLIASIAMEHVNRGVPLSFGFARGLGSVAYAAASLVLGRLIVRLGSGLLPVAHILFAALTIVLVFRFRPPARPAARVPEDAQKPPERDSLLGFVGRYRRFFAFLLGVMSLCFCARVVGTYLIKIIQNLGGSSAQLGAAAAIAAVIEFPVMAGFTRLRLRFGCVRLLKLAGVFYTLKAAGLIFAPSIPLLYLANCLQVMAYALFLPAFTYYINALMADRDRVRGQTFGMAAMTAGDVLGALMCGLLPAGLPMRTVLLIGLAVSVCGSLAVALIAGPLAEER